MQESGITGKNVRLCCKFINICEQFQFLFNLMSLIKYILNFVVNYLIIYKYTFRYNLIISCPMNLQFYPMDIQKCDFNVASCKYIWSVIFLTGKSVKRTTNINISLLKCLWLSVCGHTKILEVIELLKILQSHKVPILELWHLTRVAKVNQCLEQNQY